MVDASDNDGRNPSIGDADAPTAPAFVLWSKWRLAAVYWAAQTLLLWLVLPAWFVHAGSVDVKAGRPWGSLDPEAVLSAMLDWRAWMWILGTSAVIGVMQAVMLLPVRRPTFRAAGGVPLALSVGVVAFCGVAMATGLVVAVVHTAVLYAAWSPARSPSVSIWWFIAGATLIAWTVGGVLLWSFVRRAPGSRESVLGRLAARLFVGTLVETAAILPLDVLVRKRESCYCAAGTFAGLLVCFTVGLVALGPMIALPAIARRRQRWYGGRCDACGYDMSGARGRGVDRCPECGCGWRES